MGYIDPQARTDQAAYIHESDWLYGDIELAEGASVWINAALRAELYDIRICLLYTSPSPRDATLSRMPSSA